MLQITTQIGKIESQADRGVKLVIYTPELKPDEMTELFKLKNDGEVISIFQPIGRKAPLLEPNLGEVKPKSKSQELRNALYRLWESDHTGNVDFDLFYNQEMDKKIAGVLDKLNDPHII